MPLILLNKPFRVLCQFTDANNRATLAEHIDAPNVYPAGRLDYDSEGLVALTDDGALQSRISSPKANLTKHYWVQVEGQADARQLERLVTGVNLKDGVARAVTATTIQQPKDLWQRKPAIRERKEIPDCWLDIALQEGRNRQIRRMTAHVGLPTLRLVRYRIGPWSVAGLAPGQSLSVSTISAWRQIKS